MGLETFQSPMTLGSCDRFQIFPIANQSARGPPATKAPPLRLFRQGCQLFWCQNTCWHALILTVQRPFLSSALKEAQGAFFFEITSGFYTRFVVFYGNPIGKEFLYASRFCRHFIQLEVGVGLFNNKAKVTLQDFVVFLSLPPPKSVIT